MCSTDAYLSARDRHWANISLEQHREMVSEANLEGSKVKYLFVTALQGRPEIHYWMIPGELVEEIAFQGHEGSSDFVFSLHIRETTTGFEIDGRDVTAFHRVLELMPGDLARLEEAFTRARKPLGERSTSRGKAAGASRPLGNAIPTGGVDGEFSIPLKGGRAATLTPPVPTARVDLERIKGWIDLMSDVLTEPTHSEDESVEQRRARAVRALGSMRQQSERGGRSAMPDAEVDEEIRRTRRSRA